MNIANVMLSRGSGGIEQAFLDYNEALSSSGHVPVPIVSCGANIERPLQDSGLTYYSIPQWGWWDVTAALLLSKIFRKESVSAIITHGNRALSLASLAFKGKAPVIAVAHNYNLPRLNGARAIIATTADLQRNAAPCQRQDRNQFVIPNIARVTRSPPTPTPFRDPPVVGAMGRMVGKKGFEILCAALAILKARNIPIRALIAGDGPCRSTLQQKIHTLGLDGDVMLLGWIESFAAKDRFWRDIDIFCLPSLHEPFGIVLLEAWAAGKPVITADTEGPGAIATNNDAVIVKKNDPDALARALHSLLEHPERAHSISIGGYNKVVEHYSPAHLAAQLNAAIQQTLS